MAPEIFLADQYDAKADLWSIGVILYEVSEHREKITLLSCSLFQAIFGRAPFSSETLEQLVVKIKEDVPVVIPTSRKLR